MQLRGVRADSAVTRYRTTTIDGIDIFYREAATRTRAGMNDN